VKHGHEIQTGAVPTLLDAVFFEVGAERAKSVVRLAVDSGYGSGILIAPDLVLTNHHVLFGEPGHESATVMARFGYEQDLSGQRRPYREAPGLPETIDGNEKLDWAIVRLAQPVDFAPALPLRVPSETPKLGERVYLIQHPRGGLKKIAFLHNDIVFADNDILQYLTDSDAGSSGSPVFNEQWEIVALHHAWRRVDTANGSEFRNEGIRIERVIESLRAKGYAS